METNLVPRTFDNEKFKALVHYVCYKASDPTKLGATKLNKILWFSDMTHYARTGRPITGESYVKQQNGPVPRHVLQTLRDLEGEGRLVIREPESTYEVRAFIAGGSPRLDAFDAEEISLVDSILNEICYHHTAGSISEATHDDIWKIAEIGEEIPYEAFLVSRLGEVTEDDILWAQECVENGDQGGSQKAS